MISLDTNILVRLAVNDDLPQAQKALGVLKNLESGSRKALVLTEMLVELAYVMETIYSCTRDEVADFMEDLLAAPVFFLPDEDVVRKVLPVYRIQGEFADHIIVARSRKNNAEQLFSFDKKLQKTYPGVVVGDL